MGGRYKKRCLPFGASMSCWRAARAFWVEMLKRGKRGKRELCEMKSVHVCGPTCLGPITFHAAAKGTKVSLSLGDRRAERVGNTFKNGLVFSSRPLLVKERVCLRVDRSTQHWHGALRVGFTAFKPTCQPLPPFAIPDLTNKPGYWAGLVPTAHAFLGSELQFWVTSCGRLMLEVLGRTQICLQEGIDVTGPLWAMIDVYGQSSAVLLLGTVKKSIFCIKKSCPTPPPPPVSPVDSCLCADQSSLCPAKLLEVQLVHLSVSYDSVQISDPDEDCVVCLERKAQILLWCGHQCLCLRCAVRVSLECKKCPLCRQTVEGLTVREPANTCARKCVGTDKEST
ncbi:E3 ubiquitin-protein ligase NEURL3 [Scleropages formosus]|uniref:E3 ubiquitin-protein ligase NEURL3-like n=1 Tax=Scleropages formosus TaxID=113540 RepID=A0A8C9RDL6_SCLFO|nr:E3 ubiquitin-protein ligase NEURL3-like [Scleropages formosus]